MIILLPSMRHCAADTLRNNDVITSFWHNYLKMTSFWRYNNVIMTSVQWVPTMSSPWVEVQEGRDEVSQELWPQVVPSKHRPIEWRQLRQALQRVVGHLGIVANFAMNLELQEWYSASGKI